ncbi:MAG: Cys-Gln thioester bond-forming surface protein [Oscillospiraceae bacterium]|nr:Cys-Gln thioester bond-forming surface protein [Oscillospiraceae bacterium]
MRQKLKRLLSLVLAFSMTMSLLSISAWATEGAREDYDYIVTLDNAQEETPVEGLAAELLARKGITDETGTWSSSDDGVLTIDGAWNAVAYRAGEVEVSYTYEAPKAPEAETPGEDLGVIPPETPGEDEGKDDTTPGENEGEDGTTPGENEGEDDTAPGENEGEDDTTPGENEGEDDTAPGENEGEGDTPPSENEGEDGTTPGENEGEDGTTPGENEGGENETTPDEIVGDDANVTEASRVYYTGPEGGEVETITETITVTWKVLVQDGEAVREIRALMREMLEKYGDGVYGEGGSCQYSPEELEAALTFFHEKMAALEEAGIGWPGWPDVYGDDAAVLAEMLEKLGYGVQILDSLRYERIYYRSPYRMDKDYNGPAIYKLNNGDLAYCADHSAAANVGSSYEKKEGYTGKAADQIRGILKYGYRGGPIENYPALVARGLSGAEALSATQAAIWHAVDGKSYGYTKRLDAGDDKWNIENKKDVDPHENRPGAEGRINALYNELITKTQPEVKKITLKNPKTDKVTAKIKNGQICYDVEVAFEVTNPIQGLVVCVSCGNTSKNITLSNKNTKYTATLTNLESPSGTIDISYSKKNPSVEINSLDYYKGSDSQDFVRLVTWDEELPSSGVLITKYNVPTYDVTINKTGDNWTPDNTTRPLAGAEFSMTVSKDGESINNWRSGKTNDDGKLTFTGIPVGFSYSIKETAAPELYHLSTVPLTGSSTKTHDVNNSLERGDLTITKTVAGDTIDKTTQWEFTINLKLPGGGALPGSYHYTITRANGSTETGNISDGGKVSLAHDDKVTISDIPAGAQYSVTEAGADENGYVTTSSGESGEIEAGKTPTAKFTNTRFNGDLLVKKVVAGNGGDENQEFDFNITLAGTSASKKVVAQKHDKDGKYVEGENTWTFTGSLDFTLKHGEYLIIKDLPNGTIYTVTEKNGNGNGYTSTVEVKTDKDPGVEPVMMFGLNNYDPENYEGANTNDVSITREKDDGDRWNIVTFTNTRELGSLEISKKIVGNTSSDEVNRLWEFEITLKDVDGNPLNSQWTGYEVNGESKSPLVLDENGMGSVQLAHDQTLTFPALPVKTQYAVKEVKADTDGYKTTKPTAESGSVENTDRIYLDYTNAWTKGALEVTKTMGGPAKADERITFEIALDLSRADILKDTGTKVDVKDLANWISGDDQSENVTTQFDETGEKWIVSITKDVKTDGEEVIATLGNIPTGVTYTVTETTERLTEEGYEVVYDITGATGNVVDGKTTSGTISSDGETDKIKARDYRGEGTLVISKDVTGNAIENAGEQFEFTIDLLVPKTATEDIIKETVQIAFESKMYPNVSHELVPNGEIEEGEKAGWHKWTLTANLVDDAKLTVSGLPAATEYTVKEMKANANGYITTVTFSGTAQNVTINNADGTASGTIANSKPDDKTVVDSYLYTNMRNQGDLAILKLIDGDGAYDEDDFNFTLKLISAYAYSKTETGGEAGAGFVDDDVDPMGVDTLNNSQHWWNAGIIGQAAYSVIGMDGEPVKEGSLYDDFYDVSDGLFHFSLKGGQMLIVNGLPNETWYEVTEDNFNGNGYSSTVIDDPYGMEPFDEADGVVLPEAGITETGIGGYIPGIDIDGKDGVTELDKITSTVLFQNHRGTGELSITKELRGSGADAGRSWTFDVVLRDANGELLTKSEWTTNGEPNAIELDGQAVTLENGTVTFTMRGGETRTITGLPNGTTYTITEREANQEGYDTYLGGGDGWTGVIDEAGEKTVFSVTVVNRRDPGTLTVRKTVAGNAGWRYRDRLFDFTVALEAAPGDTLPVFVEVEGSSDSPAVEAPAYTQLEVVNGEVSFQLTDGQSLTIKNLSKDTRYTVAEAPVTEYYFDGVTTEGDLEGVIDPEETLGVHFINRFYEGPGGDDDDDDDDETTRTFEEPPEEYYPELPDPNEPDSPDTVTILEDDVPTTYVKVPDPENEEEFVYIPEDDVPLFGFEIPETGDSGRTVLWAALSAVSLTGIVVLSLPSRKKEEEE